MYLCKKTRWSHIVVFQGSFQCLFFGSDAFPFWGFVCITEIPFVLGIIPNTYDWKQKLTRYMKKDLLSKDVFFPTSFFWLLRLAKHNYEDALFRSANLFTISFVFLWQPGVKGCLQVPARARPFKIRTHNLLPGTMAICYSYTKCFWHSVQVPVSLHPSQRLTKPNSYD